MQFLKTARPYLAGLTLHCMLTYGHSEHVIHAQVQYNLNFASPCIIIQFK
jgi:hypothetical protein